MSKVGSGSDSRADGVTLGLEVDLAVPSPPGLGSSEHMSTTAHVTEGSLSCKPQKKLKKGKTR